MTDQPMTASMQDALNRLNQDRSVRPELAPVDLMLRGAIQRGGEIVAENDRLLARVAQLETKVAQRDKLIKELKECPVCDAAIKDLTVKLRLAMHGLRKIAAGGLTPDGRAWAPRDYRDFAQKTINQQ